MSIKKILIFLYKKLSIIYVFVFGRKSMQFFNDIVLSLSLNAKGFKNYGNLNLTGEKRFIKLIGKEINFSIDSLSMGLFLRAIVIDFAILSLSKGALRPLFFITVNSLN